MLKVLTHVMFALNHKLAEGHLSWRCLLLVLYKYGAELAFSPGLICGEEIVINQQCVQWLLDAKDDELWTRMTE